MFLIHAHPSKRNALKENVPGEVLFHSKREGNNSMLRDSHIFTSKPAQHHHTGRELLNPYIKVRHSDETNTSD